jgi:hypothetical protein
MNPSLLTRFDAWFKHVGKSRDGILVVGGALYILGYIVWSINAFINKLGLLPAFESQYFIAGIVPFVIIFLAILLIRFSWKKNPHFPPWLNIWKGKWWKTLLQLVFPIAVGVLNAKRTDLIGRYFTGHRNLIGGILAGIVGVFVILALFSFDPSSDRPKLGSPPHGPPKKELRALTRFVILSLVITVLGIGALYFWVGLLYSKLPQPLGGVRPRCAYLDIENDGLSKDTLRAILPLANPTPSPTPSPPATPPTAPNIVRSEKVDVLFSGSDYILIRVGSGVYEIKRDVIHAVRSCD